MLRAVGQLPEACDAGGGLTRAVAYERLAHQNLDLLFDLKRRDSSYMADQVRDGRFRVVAVDNCKGQCGNEPGLKPFTLEAGSHNPRFCPVETPTVQVTKLIICPDTLSEWDARNLADGLTAARSQTVAAVKNPGGLTISPHPGTQGAGPLGLAWVWRTVRDYWYVALSTAGLAAWTAAQAWERANRSPDLAPVPPVQVPAGAAQVTVLLEVADDATPVHRLLLTAEPADPGLFQPAGGLTFGLVNTAAGDLRWQLVLRPAPGAAGETVVRVTADDREGGRAEQPVRVRFAPLALPPAPAAPAGGPPMAAGQVVRSGRPDGLQRAEEAVERFEYSLAPDPAAAQRRLDRLDKLRRQLGPDHADLVNGLRGRVKRAAGQRTTSDTATAPTAAPPSTTGTASP